MLIRDQCFNAPNVIQFQTQKVVVLLVMVTMFPAARIMALAKLEREAVVLTASAKGICFVEQITADCLMQAQMPAWIVVLVNINKIVMRG